MIKRKETEKEAFVLEHYARRDGGTRKDVEGRLPARPVNFSSGGGP